MKELHRRTVGSLVGAAACIGTLLVMLSDPPLAADGPPVVDFYALHAATPYGSDDLMLFTEMEGEEEWEYVKADEYLTSPVPLYRKTDVYTKNDDDEHTTSTEHTVIVGAHVVSEKHILKKSGN